ncbi:MAG TPA: HIT family protein [Bryobacteraceae bacterium]|nr:HIT family protein [Bryobacteraceae bacterium]
MMACKFCEIAAGATTHAVFEDAGSIAFLDTRPLFPGHVLLIPREHIETLPELPPEAVGPFFRNAQLLTRAVQEAMGADGVLNAVNNVISQSVPHLHLHIVPRRRGDGLRGFFWPRHTYHDEGEAASIAEQIRLTVSRLLVR